MSISQKAAMMKCALLSVGLLSAGITPCSADDLSGPDHWTIKQASAWTFRSQNGNYTLTSTAPRDTVVFERSANTFTLKGSGGGVGILLDVARLFQMQEVAEWRKWKPIIGPPFDPAYR